MPQRTYRQELKYLIHYPDAALLRQRLGAVMRRDAHAGPDGRYRVRSLYFDDLFGTAYAQKVEGLGVRRKYRVRVYGAVEGGARLERKSRCGAGIFKQSAALTEQEARRLERGDAAFLRDSGQALSRECYCDWVMRGLRARVVVDYEREAFVLPEGDVRITLDTHVRAGLGSLYDAKLPMVEALGADRLILEVKFTNYLPRLVRRLLPPDACELTAASKYVMCCDALAGRRVEDERRRWTWKAR